jgi:hypothetical protein
VSGPTGPRSTPANGSAPHFAHTQPRDSGVNDPCTLDTPHSI